jgi:hypothetical protein
MDDEVRRAFSRREPTKHFSTQIDIWVYGFVHEIRAERAEFHRLEVLDSERVLGRFPAVPM